MTQRIVLIGDGDRIRESIEALLLAERFQDLEKLSKAIDLSVQQAAEYIAKLHGERVCVAAGDDILIVLTKGELKEEAIAKAQSSFQDNTGLTLSFGAGSTAGEAYVNLRRAKSDGGGILVWNARDKG